MMLQIVVALVLTFLYVIRSFIHCHYVMCTLVMAIANILHNDSLDSDCCRRWGQHTLDTCESTVPRCTCLTANSRPVSTS